MKKSKQIYVFIDSQNLNLGVLNPRYINGKRIVDWQLDFEKFLIYLKDKYSVNKTYLFIGQVAGNETLYTKLQEYGYVLVFKPTLEIKKGPKSIVKGNVDAELVLHTMINFPNYDTAIIVTGDGDFHCLIEYLVESKKLEALLIPNKYKYSSLLRKFSKYINFVNTKRDKLEQINKREV